MMRLALLSVVVTMMGCAKPPPDPVSRAAEDLDIQGHRGARGLAPENTIPSFLAALDHGVTTLEMDVAISADSQVVLSHEPWMNAAICSHPDGRSVSEDEAMGLNLFTMTLEQIQAFDCGARGHEGFPEQERMAVHKPTLSAVVEAVRASKASTRYNIEIKSSPEGDDRYHPSPDAFARLLLTELTELRIQEAVTIQSFDPRALESVRRQDPGMSVAWLVGNEDGFEANMARLSFVPDIYSPHHRLVDAELVQSVHEAGMQLIPWTINDSSRMQELIALGVDGLITDYPDRAAALRVSAE